MLLLKLENTRVYCNVKYYLGSIWPNIMMDSGIVDGFDSYYTSEKTTLNVADLLDDVFFILVPEENVDARMHYTRNSASGFNQTGTTASRSRRRLRICSI